MDPFIPLGAVASATQLASLTANIGLKLYRLLGNIKYAPQNSKELCDEISELSSVINDLVDSLNSIEENSDIIIADIVSMDSLNKYQQFLKDVSFRFSVNKTDLKKRLKWPLSLKENEELIAKIERHKSQFTLALQSASFRLGCTQRFNFNNH